MTSLHFSSSLSVRLCMLNKRKNKKEKIKKEKERKRGEERRGGEERREERREVKRSHAKERFVLFSIYSIVPTCTSFLFSFFASFRI